MVSLIVAFLIYPSTAVIVTSFDVEAGDELPPQAVNEVRSKKFKKVRCKKLEVRNSKVFEVLCLNTFFHIL